MWFCGLASVTSNSRMLFAFARDGGVPMHEAVARVSPRWRTPHVAVWLSVLAAFVVSVWSKAYAAVAALSTIALYASYGLPVAIGLRARMKGRWNAFGPWDLGRWSNLVNVLAIAWTLVILVLFVLPPNELAGETFYGLLALLGVYWFGWMRARFKGPRVLVSGAVRDEVDQVPEPSSATQR